MQNGLDSCDQKEGKEEVTIDGTWHKCGWYVTDAIDWSHHSPLDLHGIFPMHLMHMDEENN